MGINPACSRPKGEGKSIGRRSCRERGEGNKGRGKGGNVVKNPRGELGREKGTGGDCRVVYIMDDIRAI